MPSVIKCGVTPDQFWEYTLEDMNIVLKAENMKFKEKTRLTYDQALITIAILGAAFGGKDIPSYSEFYTDTELDPKGNSTQNMSFQKDVWIEYAKQYNQHRKKE